MQDWQDFTYAAKDGLRLAGRKYGWENRDALPVVCLAGLSRNSRDFHEFALHISRDAVVRRRVLTLDYRGRGRSQYDENWENYNPLQEADDAVQGMIAAGIGRANIVGTSRGGLIAMLLAAIKPGMMHCVVLNDVGPVIDGAGLVRIKKMLETGHHAASWEEAADRLKRAGERDFPKRTDAEWMHHARMIFTEAQDAKLARKGALVRDFDLNLAKTVAAIDLDTPLPRMWPQFDGLAKHPLMVIRGENSDLLSEDVVEKMKASRASMEVVVVPDEGHAPDIGVQSLAARVSEFLDRHEPQGH